MNKPDITKGGVFTEPKSIGWPPDVTNEDPCAFIPDSSNLSPIAGSEQDLDSVVLMEGRFERGFDEFVPSSPPSGNGGDNEGWGITKETGVLALSSLISPRLVD